MTTPAGNDAWDLERIRQIVTQNDLERGRLEYKRELGSGRGALEAITALANTFGGVVLIGVDETKQGTDRLTGVPAVERTRLVSMCWSRLTPPFSPEIIPISLGHDDLYVLAVDINTDYIRRPVMLSRENKILVRLDDQNQAPDWYRLRDLFTEQPASDQDTRLPPADPTFSTRQGQYPDTDLGLRGRLLLTGPRSRRLQIRDAARPRVLTDLNRNDAALTGAGSALSDFMHQMAGNSFNISGWQLEGLANARQFTARWQALEPKGRALTEARIRTEVTPRGDTLLITLEILLTDSRRPNLVEVVNSLPSATDGNDEDRLNAFLSRTAYTPTPLISIGALRKLMLDITCTLWGQPGETISTNILGQPLGPPALLDLTIYTTPIYRDTDIPPLNTRIDFGTAQLIPGNIPGTWTNLGPLEPDRATLGSPAGQAPIIHDWLNQLGIENGYQDIEQEVARWTGTAAQ
jgi:hypothetical protein